ncbi:MAG TPA: GTP-binding protein [Kofleriaceae bacterium]|nr:GTP-binding protein [Kofleriaceae bacterium]
MRVPLVVVTGFLGAGKTTLVNRLLAKRAERGSDAIGKLAVIVNELGAVGIDGALLGQGGARQVELPGGCVCCVLGDELDTTLLDMVCTEPDAILLETTGVAEPLPIAWAVQRDPVSSAVRLAAVVTLVDATNFLPARDVSAAVDAQVAYADVLLVTKAELAGEAATQAAIAAATALAPRALVRIGTTDEHAAWLEQTLADPALEHVPAAHAHDDHDHDHHVVDSLSLPIPRTIDLEELEDQLAELPASFVRIKGIARALDEHGHAAWVAFHRVGLRVSSEPLARAPDGFSDDRGVIVALGRDLREDQLAAAVAAAIV